MRSGRFTRVLARVPDARLEIYGDGPERGKYERLIDRLGVRESVRLMGWTPDPGAVLQRAALSLLTSRGEGLGLAIIESLGRGCSVVSYDILYGPSEMIADGVNGLLVPSGDIAGLADAVVRLLTDRRMRERFSDAAPQAAQGFTAQAYVARWSALYNRLDAEGWGAAPAVSRDRRFAAVPQLAASGKDGLKNRAARSLIGRCGRSSHSC